MQKISCEKLFELYKIINPSSITFEEYKNECDDSDIQKVLISEIEDYLSETNYNGPFEHEPIYYYFKGIDLVMNKNKELLKNLPNHAKKLKEFHKFRPKYEGADFLELAPAEDNKENMQSFKEWKAQEPSQNEVVEQIMDHLIRHKTNWRIDFSKLTNVGRELIFEP